jgi:hypothetical protein
LPPTDYSIEIRGNTMRAILINPFAKTVSEVEFDGNWRSISAWLDCEIFTIIRLARYETLFIDDEGLLTDKPQAFFAWQGYPQPLAGRGLILGEDDEGETVATDLTIDEVRARVTFPAVEVVGWLPATSSEAGDSFVVRGPHPVFEPTNPTEASKERH